MQHNFDTDVSLTIISWGPNGTYKSGQINFYQLEASGLDVEMTYYYENLADILFRRRCRVNLVTNELHWSSIVASTVLRFHSPPHW